MRSNPARACASAIPNVAVPWRQAGDVYEVDAAIASVAFCKNIGIRELFHHHNLVINPLPPLHPLEQLHQNWLLD